MSVIRSGVDIVSGHYNCNLTTACVDVTLKVMKLKGISFETATIEDWRNLSLQVGRYLYVYMNEIYRYQNWVGEIEGVRLGMNGENSCVPEPVNKMFLWTEYQQYTACFAITPCFKVKLMWAQDAQNNLCLEQQEGLSCGRKSELQATERSGREGRRRH